MNQNIDHISFSHTVRVLFITCVECDTENATDIFRIFFSNIDIVDSKEQALEYFHNNRYDLIIAGLKLPEIQDGIDLIENIREITQGLTILTIAPSLQQVEFTKLIELGIDGFIVKPIEITQFSNVIHKTIEKLKNKSDLYQYRVRLENKVNEQIEGLREKDKLLAQKSKMAAMGEMIDAVAHQWRNPLNNIKMNIEMAKYDFEDGNMDKEYFDLLYNKVSEQINHMNNTLHEFRSFFRPDKMTAPFSISSIIEKTFLLMKDELLHHRIKTYLEIQNDIYLVGVSNEFIHVIINLINNSKDAFLQNNITDPKITFSLNKTKEQATLSILDNAGGIPPEIIEDIFTANVTSKEELGGTGIGLYMSKHIIEKHGGTIKVENENDGAKFSIEFKINSNI